MQYRRIAAWIFAAAFLGRAALPAEAVRIYVGSFGPGAQAGQVRRALVSELRKSKDFEVVNSVSRA